MTIKTILVHLNDLRRTERLLGAVVPLARETGAHVIGLSVLPPFIVVPATDIGGASVSIDEHRIAYQADMAAMKQQFRAATAGILAEWREADARFGSVTTEVMEHGRATDLVVASAADPAWGSTTMLEDPVRLVMECGRPVLLIPNAGRTALPPRRIMVAFDGRREAARAVFDAVPLIEKARDVSIVWLNPERAARAGDLPAAEISAALARHGAKVEAVEAHAIGADVGPELLRQAKVLGADLLVMGCYGHSRLRELILGGASRHVLAHMDLPVLLSH